MTVRIESRDDSIGIARREQNGAKVEPRAQDRWCDERTSDDDARGGTEGTTEDEANVTLPR